MFKSFWRLASILLLATGSAHVHAASSDPLFRNMEGHWKGQGKRVYAISGRVVQLSTDVVSTIRDGRLCSENHWMEQVDGSGEPREYTTSYWIAPDTAGDYLLGYNEGASAAARGTLNGAEFYVKQKAGTITIESRTVFSENHSTYLETTWNGATKISETTIEYAISEDPTQSKGQ